MAIVQLSQDLPQRLQDMRELDRTQAVSNTVLFTPEGERIWADYVMVNSVIMERQAIPREHVHSQWKGLEHALSSAPEALEAKDKAWR